MIIIRCANGVALFQITRNKLTDSLAWTCLSDASTGSQPRTPAGWEQLLRDMAQKATSLRGTISQVVDLPEIN